jgi:hypothetical protein
MKYPGIRSKNETLINWSQYPELQANFALKNNETRKKAEALKPPPLPNKTKKPKMPPNPEALAIKKAMNNARKNYENQKANSDALLKQNATTQAKTILGRMSENKKEEITTAPHINMIIPSSKRVYSSINTPLSVSVKNRIKQFENPTSKLHVRGGRIKTHRRKNKKSHPF